MNVESHPRKYVLVAGACALAVALAVLGAWWRSSPEPVAPAQSEPVLSDAGRAAVEEPPGQDEVQEPRTTEEPPEVQEDWLAQCQRQHQEARAKPDANIRVTQLAETERDITEQLEADELPVAQRRRGLVLLEEVQRSAGKAEQAMATYRRMLECLEGEAGEAAVQKDLWRRAQRRVARRRYAEAVPYLDLLIHRFPEGVYIQGALYDRARAARVLGDSEGALGWYQMLVQDFPADDASINGAVEWGQLLATRQMPDLAMAVLYDYIDDRQSLSKEVPAKVRLALASVHRRLEQQDEANVQLQLVTAEHRGSRWERLARRMLERANFANGGATR